MCARIRMLLEKEKWMPFASKISQVQPHPNRVDMLQPLVDYIKSQIAQKAPVRLNFICTHNSRRSQMAQVAAQAMATYYGVQIESLSGGVEVTACNSRTVDAFNQIGFHMASAGGQNPKYEVQIGGYQLALFSKLFDDESNGNSPFCAVMTCDHADENCPFIPGAAKRISITYSDPKEFDDTPQEKEKYLERLTQIFIEMNYVFQQVSN